MQKANQLFGKSIVSQETGQQLATVRDVILDAEARHIVALLVDGGGWFSSDKIVRWNSIVSAGDVIIIGSEASILAVRDDEEVSQLLQQAHRMTGTTLINDGGERIGTVGDLFINERGDVVGYEVKQGFVSDLGGRKFLPVENVQAVGKDAIIASDAGLTSVKAVEQPKKSGDDIQT